MKIRLNNVRLAFPALFEPKTVQGQGDPAFSAVFLFDQKHSAYKEMQAAIEKVGAEKWGAKWPKVKTEIDAKDRTCLHDGNTKADYAGFEDQWYVSARNKVRPTVLDTQRQPLAAQDGKPYAGCYVNGVVELWAQDNQYGKRINATLAGVQFVRDGDAFAGGRAASEDDFEVLGDGADAEALV